MSGTTDTKADETHPPTKTDSEISQAPETAGKAVRPLKRLGEFLKKLLGTIGAHRVLGVESGKKGLEEALREAHIPKTQQGVLIKENETTRSILPDE